MTYYIVGGSTYDNSEYKVYAYCDHSGYPDGEFGDRPIDIYGAPSDPYWALGLNTETMASGQQHVELGLLDSWRIKITASGMWGYHTASGWMDILGGGGGPTPDHNDLNGLNAGDDYEHITQTQKDALHSVYTLEQHNNSYHSTNYHTETDGTGTVTVHSDVSDAGSGIIISDAERTGLHTKYTDGEAVSAVATADPYVRNDTSDTMNGTLTVGGLFVQNVSTIVKVFETGTSNYMRIVFDSGAWRIDYDTDGDGDYTPYTTPITISAAGVTTLAALTMAGAITMTSHNQTFTTGKVIVPNGIWSNTTGATDAYIWAVSGAYPTYGLYYNTGSPDYLEIHWVGNVTTRFNMEAGDMYLYDSTSADYVRMYHSGSHGYITTGGTGGGDLYLNPAGNVRSSKKIYNAVYNDYADYIPLAKNQEKKPGMCYYETGEGLAICNEKNQFGAFGICSNTYGYATGVAKGAVPISVAGIVLAYVDKVYKAGTILINNKDGILTKAKKKERYNALAMFMRKETKIKTKGVKVKGRYWVKVL